MTPLEALEQGFRVIVPNERLARYWMEQLTRKQSVVLFHPIVSFTQWISQLFDDECYATPVLCLSDRDAYLWLWYIFQRSRDKAPCPRTFFKSYQRLKRWRQTEHELSLFPKNAAQERFLKFYRVIQEHKKREKIAFFEDKIEILIQHFSQKSSYNNANIYLYGFDDIYPLAQAFFDVYKMHNQVYIERASSFEDVKKAVLVEKYAFSEDRQQWDHALNWLKNTPAGHRCAIIVPDLDRRFQHITKKSLSVFDPLLLRSSLSQQSHQISFSHGCPLADEPIIQIWKAAILEASSSQQMILWSQWLDFWLAFSQKEEIFFDWTLSSREYQAIDTLKKHLQDAQNLSSLLGLLDFHIAMNLLSQLLENIIFQPQSLQSHKMILGLLEAAALPWDAIWLIDSDHTRFPQSLELDPLLPFDLQERFDYPHSSFKKERGYLNGILKRLQSQTREKIILSFYKSLEHLPSFIINDIFPGHYQSPSLSRFKKNKEIFSFITPKSPKTSDVLSVSIIDAFSRCPFYGFARSLKALQRVTEADNHPYIDPRYYGNLVHRMIQNSLGSAALPYDDLPFPEDWILAHYMHWKSRLELCKLPYKHFDIEQSFEYAGPRGWRLIGRMDLYHSESRLIIDIKSTFQSLGDWLRENPKSWQGPIYALAKDASTLGVLSIQKDLLVYQEGATEGYLVAWKKNLDTLLAQWEVGDHEPAPVDLSVCRICLYKPSCRYHLIKMDGDLHDS